MFPPEKSLETHERAKAGKTFNPGEVKEKQ
jgi:hypothetical protein